MTFSVHFAPEAVAQLAAIEDYIANEASSPAIAANYVDAIVDYCERFSIFPQRGMRRDDLLQGLRITNFRGSAVIAFMVDLNSETVAIVGVFYGGQDYETALATAADAPDDRHRGR